MTLMRYISLAFMVFLILCPLANQSAAQAPDLPNFVDQRQRLVKPDLANVPRIRFLTATDYPPFNFLDSRGLLVGFNVDLARAICAELQALQRCQVEALPFSELKTALEAGRGEAVIAGLSINAESRRDLLFTQSYLRYPARFVTRKEAPIDAPLAQSLSGKQVGVVGQTAHEAMFRAYFPGVEPQVFETRNEALAALKAGTLDTVFGDGIGLSFWLESEPAAGCCMFSGGPFLSDDFLGEGLAIAVLPRNGQLADAFDYAIVQLVKKGTFSELLLRYFPVSAW